MATASVAVAEITPDALVTLFKRVHALDFAPTKRPGPEELLQNIPVPLRAGTVERGKLGNKESKK